MTPRLRLLAAAVVAADAALAQKSGGILNVYHRDSPGSMSILEEATNSTEIPMMGVFNNLVLYKQDEPQNSMQTIVPDLATSWSWSEEGIQLAFSLRWDVVSHDAAARCQPVHHEVSKRL
jgi:peptide/nickel transport system substrate-binding protein